MTSQLVTPGQRIGIAQDFISGPGTYVRGNYIYASLVGQKLIEASSNGKLPTLSVIREKQRWDVPQVNSIITGKVIRITPKEAVVSIMVVGQSPCKEDFQGIIRIQDIRATEKDKTKIYDSYRPGDIVRAEVISLGDSRSYYLSTAKNELGVIYAQSVAGITMVPVSWQEMQCPKTKAIEYRKFYNLSVTMPPKKPLPQTQKKLQPSKLLQSKITDLIPIGKREGETVSPKSPQKQKYPRDGTAQTALRTSNEFEDNEETVFKALDLNETDDSETELEVSKNNDEVTKPEENDNFDEAMQYKIKPKNSSKLTFHDEDLTPEKKLLHAFDLDYDFGPCIGITRLERWERAKKFALNPSLEIKRLLVAPNADADPEIRESHFFQRV
ncbi:hypothetical protein G9A89_016360 [Geosiphon pyriformis]|nr:hypothetical protein G9A89_016360 [Geosiphon pyriformis]